jgi:hypothetical protein
MPSGAPRLVDSLVSSSPIIGAVQMLAGIGLAITGRRPLEPFLGFAMALFAIVVTFRAIRVASTRVPDAGVSQLSLRGRLHLPFAEVTGLTRNPYGLTLSAQQRAVIVPVDAFENTADAIEYIESRLPSSVVRN